MRRLAALPLGLALLGAAPPTAQDVAGDLVSTMKLEGSAKLLDAGTEPRAVLRFAPRAGASTTVRSTTSVAMQATMSGMALPLPPPAPLVQSTRVTVGPPADTGFTTVHFQPLDGATAGVADVKDLAFDVLVDPSGTPVQVDVTGSGAGADLLQQVSDQVVQEVPRFPAEPVGPGATWTVTLRLSVAGLRLDGTATCTLKSVADGVAHVATELALTADPSSKLAMPGLPLPAQVDVTSLTGRSTGESAIDLATMTTAGSMTTDLSLQMGVGLGGQSQSVSMAIHEDTTSTVQ